MGVALLTLLLSAAFALMAPAAAQAQETGAVRGTVTGDIAGEPLPGVNVVVETTGQGAATDGEGQYTITGVEPGLYTVRASFIGYGDEVAESVEVQAGDTTVVDIVMQQSQMGLDEVVVVGYGTQQRKDLTGSISSIGAAEEAQTQVVTSVEQFLQGRVPGLNAGVATEADGEMESGALTIRGQTSISAENDPLIVVDGATYFGRLSDINPNDVESIDVLKGASAAAVYGANAAAGVIEVTTKTGSSPEPTINFKTSLGMARQGRFVEPYGPEAYLDLIQVSAMRKDPSAAEHFYANPENLPEGVTLEEWRALGTGSGEPMEIWLSRIGLSGTEIENFMEGNTINWHDEVFRSAALRQNYDVSVSGNPNDIAYYLSLGYTDNQGEHVGDRFRTVRARMNLSSTVTDWLEVDFKSQYANRNEGFLGANAGETADLSPYGDMYEEDGSLKWYPHEDDQGVNPFLWTTQSGRQREQVNNNLLGNLSANVTLPLGLGYRVRWTNDLNFGRDYLFNPSTTPMGEPAGNAYRHDYTDYRWQVDNILTWDRTLADVHAFDATFLFNVEAESIWRTESSNDQFDIETLGYGGLPLGANPQIESDDERVTGTALMGRLNYRLLDRYLFTASYRRDGYSAFGQTYPYAYFPSVAFAWRASEEPFFDVDAVSNLKLRLSWGKNGNRNIGTYIALQRLDTEKYIHGSETVTGIESDNLPNRDLKWESTSQYNAGLDLGLFSGRLSATVDAYYMSTSDLLLRRSLPDITGYGSIWTNLGEVVNRGLELSLTSTNVATERLVWNSTLNFSLNRNEIKSLYGTGEDDRQNNWFIGHSLHQIYDYEILGVWQEDQAEAAAEYGREPGDFRLRDVNGDGVLTPLEDKVFQGYTEPRYRVSLVNDVSYRAFTLSALLTSDLGQYTAHNDARKHSDYWRFGRLNDAAYPYWTPENPTNEWARIASIGDSPFFNYWERTSFVRLQNFSLAYRIPRRLTQRLSAQDLRVFFNAQNVFVLTGYSGNDPETHEHTPRLYSLGVNVSF